MSRRRTVAMVVIENAGYLIPRGAADCIASMLAPTGSGVQSIKSPEAFATGLWV